MLPLYCVVIASVDGAVGVMISKNIIEVFHQCSLSCPYAKKYPECPFRMMEGLSYESRKSVFDNLGVKQATAIMEMAAKQGCPTMQRLLGR